MTDSNQATPVIQTIALCRYCGVTPRMFGALLAHFGNLERVIRADSGTLMAISGIGVETTNRIAAASEQLAAAEEHFNQSAARDITIVSRLDETYPRRLFELNDPPSLLYVRGMMPDNETRMVALVGGENATNDGIKLTVKLARRFTAEGVSVVSSLNAGIDAAAHLGIRAENGTSFAVLEAGFDQIHPAENAPLAVDILKSGGLISEYAPDAEFKENNYCQSNRLIAGLTQAVVITELYHGSMRTLDLLNCCSQIGKLVFVMIDPELGALADQASLNDAVANGAIPIIGLDRVDDIIKSLV